MQKVNFTSDTSAVRAAAVSHPVGVDWDVDHHVDQIAQRQAGDEEVGAAPHGLVAVDDLQQCRVAHDAHHKHQQRHGRVDVLEGASDPGRLGAHWRRRRRRSENRAVGLRREEAAGRRMGRFNWGRLGTAGGRLSSGWHQAEQQEEEEEAEERRRPHC